MNHEEEERVANRKREHEQLVERIKEMLGGGRQPLDIAKELRVDPTTVWDIKNRYLIGLEIVADGQVIEARQLEDAEEYIARFEADVQVEFEDAEAGRALGICGLTVPEGRRIILFGPPTDVTCLHEIAHLRVTLDHDDAWAEEFKSLLRAAGLPRRWRAVPKSTS